MRPKPAFFAIARELRPFTVGMARKDVKTLDNPSSEAFFKIEQSVSSHMLRRDVGLLSLPFDRTARNLGKQFIN